eukprot:CAMPEP_0171594260 /NCGR_PEP_ID=MMETSP0990-20121206/591_1 /TAXON_ID=483369 /ORGANISM="non described non described, Strain CCMP2098" /LENGTH=182 /DNA_ID=CAMNT_0012154931 /DNA_START=9 /DNA_END=557 /DNA_ORIENTATION=-
MSRLNLKKFLESVPVVAKVPMRWGDMDAFQHLNNCEYFRFQEAARLKYFEAMCIEIKSIYPTNELNFDEATFMNATGFGPILANTTCRFKFPVSFPDVLLVGSSATKLEADRFTLIHTAWSLKHERVVSEGSGIVVTVDYSKEGKKCNLHPAMIKGIDALQKKHCVGLVGEFEGITATQRFE